jgi:polysaccharide biosynthesis/export protein
MKLLTKKSAILLIVLLAMGYSDTVWAQSTDDIAAEARRRNINSREDALGELAKNGISLNQAQEMAQLRGLDFESFLQDYLSENGSVGDQGLAQESETVTQIMVVTPDDIQVPEQAIVAPAPKADPNYFGYSIFENNPFGQKEYLVGNIDEGYLLAPGDELRISVFGDNNLDMVSKIDLNGNLTLPKLGVFQAAGQSYATLKNRLGLFLGKFYSGLLTVPQRSFLDVSLTQIRPVKVTILGQVNTPGPHLVNGLATVLNSLYASGGVRTSGTLRDIKIYRGNKLIKSIDIYDYITKGAIDQDIRLANNDIIYVGQRVSSVNLQGAVNQPGIYELLPGEGTKALFDFSGGLPIGASLSNVNISRITPFDSRDQIQKFDRFLTTIDLSGSQERSGKGFTLRDGDIVSVQGILDKEINKVTITGSVYQPGTYALDEFSDLKTLIESGAKGLLENTFREKVDISGQDQEGNLYFKTYNLSSVLSGKTPVILAENDQVRIFSLSEVEGEQKVTISGFVDAPKTVFWRSDLSMFDLIFQATSFQELDFQNRVLAQRVDLKRYDKTTGRFEISQYSLERLDELKSTNLLARDQVILYTKGVNENLNPQIAVTGGVNAPGTLSLNQNMYPEDAIISAGGFVNMANKNTVTINRADRDLAAGRYSKLIEYTLDLDYLLGKSPRPTNPFILEDKDIIRVKLPIDPNLQPRVVVSGQINYPGTVVFEKDKISLDAVLALSGGLTANASIEASYILRDGLILFAELREHSSKDINLLDGDQIVIGSRNAPVKTIGNVFDPTVFSWTKGKRAKYYLRNSGGVKKKNEATTVNYANGRSRKIGFFKNPVVYPGSSIIALAKAEEIQVTKENTFMDDFIRIFSVVTGALTAALLASKL